MESTEQKKGKGRPKGSKNKQYKQATERKPVCPHCQKTALATISGGSFPTQHYDIIVEGVRYNTIVRKRAKCKACGIKSIIRGYENR